MMQSIDPRIQFQPDFFFPVNSATPLFLSFPPQNSLLVVAIEAAPIHEGGSPEEEDAQKDS